MTRKHSSLIPTRRDYLDPTGAAPSLLELGPNLTGNDYFVGDLHGEGNLLKSALKQVGFNWDCDRLFAVGDLVDRGKAHRELFETLMGKSNFYSVLGNHDVDAIDYLQDFLHCGKSLPSGESSWAREFAVHELKAVHQFLCQLPLSVRVSLKDGRRIGVLHADLPDGLNSYSDLARIPRDILPLVPDRSALDTILWGRRRAQTVGKMLTGLDHSQTPPDHSESCRLLDVGGDVDLILCGHSIMPTGRPVEAGNWIFLDTGSGYPPCDPPDAFLSIVDPLNRRAVQAFHTKGGTIQTNEFMLGQPLDI